MNQSDAIKGQIFLSFETLLKQYSFSEITIKMIIEDCGISRMTFYRHFHDKYDIPRWFYKSIVNIVDDEGGRYSFSRIEYTTRLLGLMNEKRSFFQKALSYSGQNALSDYIYSEILACVRNRILGCSPLDAVKDDGEDDMISKEIALSIKMYAIGMFWIIYEWINNQEELPAEVIAEIICDNIPAPIDKYFREESNEYSQVVSLQRFQRM
jgi:AcrR family transcriptional regulator